MPLTMKRALSMALCLFLPLPSMAFDIRHGSIPIQLGGLISSQGKAQNLNIQGLVGNQYTVNNNNQGNGLFGIGYYIKGLDKDRFQLSYGVNGFYLGATSVIGTIVQEHLFTNLAYNYKIQQVPIYLAAKGTVKNNSEKYNVTFDAGIGPNFMRTSGYKEIPLNGYTLPDNALGAHNNVAFTAMAGVGLRLNKIFGQAPLECGYRFFYLGQGELQANNNQLLNAIKTGNTYANAIMCSVIV